MSELTIRPPRPDELAAVGALTVAAYRTERLVSDDYSLRLADTRTRSQGAELLVAVDAADHLLGTITIALPSEVFAELAREDELEFRMLAVAPGARGNGVGEALVRHVLARARELNLPRVVLSSHELMTTAHRLYHRLGFHRMPDRDWRTSSAVNLLAFALDL